MKLLKSYFLSNKNMLLALPIIIFCLAFYWHYVMVMSYQEDLFKYSNEAFRNEILMEEYGLYKNNLTNNALMYLLQIIGITLSLNIGLLFLGCKVSFKSILNVVLKSSLALVVVYLIVPTLLYFKENVYSFTELYKIESYSTLVVFTEEFTHKGIKNALEAFSVTQLLFVCFLAVGIKYLMHCTYKKSLLQTIKIYGLAFVLWLCFALAMDLNFS